MIKNKTPITTSGELEARATDLGVDQFTGDKFDRAHNFFISMGINRAKMPDIGRTKSYDPHKLPAHDDMDLEVHSKVKNRIKNIFKVSHSDSALADMDEFRRGTEHRLVKVHDLQQDYLNYFKAEEFPEVS